MKVLKKLTIMMATLAALLGLVAPVAFALPSVTGQLVISPTVAGLQEDDLFSNTEFYLIYEGQFTVTNLKVDVLGNAPGIYDQTGDLTTLANRPTVSGTYQSWIIHSDPQNSAAHNYVGTATFEADIVGLMLVTNTLSAADGCGTQSNNPNPPGHCTNMDPINALYGTNYMRYSFSDERGMEFGTGTAGDRVEYISPRTLDITQFHTSTAVDEVRILTLIPTTVPEPATMLLLGLGLVGIAGIRRKFKN